MVVAQAMAVAMDEQHRPLESLSLLAQRLHELAVAARRLPSRGRLEVSIGMHRDHHAREPALAREGKRLAQPVKIGRVACAILGGGLRGTAVVVIAADDVQGDESHAVQEPAHVLHVIGEVRQRTFPLDRERRLCRIEQLAKQPQPIERLIVAAAFAMAIGPVVVAGRDEERMADGVEQCLALAIELVVARIARALDVADVHDEGERLAVDVGEELFQPHLLEGIVGRIAKRGEGEAVLSEGLSRAQCNANEERVADETHGSWCDRSNWLRRYMRSSACLGVRASGSVSRSAVSAGCSACAGAGCGGPVANRSACGLRLAARDSNSASCRLAARTTFGGMPASCATWMP